MVFQEKPIDKDLQWAKLCQDYHLEAVRARAYLLHGDHYQKIASVRMLGRAGCNFSLVEAIRSLKDFNCRQRVAFRTGPCSWTLAPAPPATYPPATTPRQFLSMLTAY